MHEIMIKYTDSSEDSTLADAKFAELHSALILQISPVASKVDNDAFSLRRFLAGLFCQ